MTSVASGVPVNIEFPERFNMGDYFLYHNAEEGRENNVSISKIANSPTATR